MQKIKNVKIQDYIYFKKLQFKKYKNVEKLKLIGKPKDKQDKPDKEYFLLINQNGNEVVKSDFLLQYDYNKNAHGLYVPKYNKNIEAAAISESIKFSNSFGGLVSLEKGDYVIKYNGIIDGMKKEVFEENYKTVYKAKKEEDLTF